MNTKQTAVLGFATFGILLVCGLAIAATRPQWLPTWARDAATLLPAWVQARGSAAPSEDDGLYCKEHGVPEKFCTLCHEELTKSLLLCKEHGDIPEDICTLCHPEVEAKHKIEMCNNHGLPKHFCYLCGKGPSAMRDEPDDGWCAAHGKPEADCQECLATQLLLAEDKDKTAKAKMCRSPLPRVRLASASLARKIGLQTAKVGEEEHAHKLLANAETAYDANHYADISPRVSGFIREVKVDLGQIVRAGDVLAVIDSAEISTAKAQYLTSKATVKLAEATADRTQLLSKSGAVPGKLELEVLTSLNQAQASVMDSEQKLRNLGFEAADLARILEVKDTGNALSIVAPIGGMIVARHAVKGEAVQPTSQLFAVTDTSRMWLWIDVYESDIAKVHPGQPVRFVVSGADPSDPPIASGKITWIGSDVNEQSRTARVRAELANPRGNIRANQYGEATIEIGDPHKAIVVPKEAVQRKDNVDVVFLPEEEGTYRPQRVITRATGHGDLVEVTWGLKPGQTVVSKGAFLLKTEIMKGAIGAGCCE